VVKATKRTEARKQTKNEREYEKLVAMVEQMRERKTMVEVVKF
jgi:hypothetical protein